MIFIAKILDSWVKWKDLLKIHQTSAKRPKKSQWNSILLLRQSSRSTQKRVRRIYWNKLDIKFRWIKYIFDVLKWSPQHRKGLSILYIVDVRRLNSFHFQIPQSWNHLTNELQFFTFEISVEHWNPFAFTSDPKTIEIDVAQKLLMRIKEDSSSALNLLKV